MTVLEWNNKLQENRIRWMYLTEEDGIVYFVYEFGKYGNIHIPIPQYAVDPILEKLYDREMDFQRKSILFRLGCKCWNKDIDTLTSKFQLLFNDYETTGDIQPIINEINSYCPEYISDKYPEQYGIIFHLHDSFYDRDESYLSKFLNDLFSNIKVRDVINLCGRSQGYINKWFYTETEYSFGIGKIRIICDLSINTLDWIGADICHRYDKIFDSIFDKSSSGERESKLKEIIRKYNYNDLIDCLSRDITYLQPVQVYCGGAPMYEHKDHEFIRKLYKGRVK